MNHGSRHRQLRLVHLQPRAVPRRAGRRGPRAPQRPGHASARSRRWRPEQIVISPGPGGRRTPASRWTSSGGSGRARRSSASASVIRRSAWSTAAPCAARTAPMHGKTSTVVHDGKGVFAGISEPFQAGRYHSLVIASDSVPAELEVAARTKEDGTIMARAAPDVSGARRAVSSRVGADRRGAADPAELPGSVMFTAADREARSPRGPHRGRGRRRPCARSWRGARRRRRSPALLAALVMKGERPAEIVGFARTMREHAVKLSSAGRRGVRHLRHRRRSVRHVQHLVGGRARRGRVRREGGQAWQPVGVEPLRQRRRLRAARRQRRGAAGRGRADAARRRTSRSSSRRRSIRR